MIIETRKFPVAVRLSSVTSASVQDMRAQERGWVLIVEEGHGNGNWLEFDEEEAAMRYLQAIEASFGEPVVVPALPGGLGRAQ